MKIILSKLPLGSQARKTFRTKFVSTNYCIVLLTTWCQLGDKLISDLGLTSVRWQVLGSLMDGPITVAEIARRMELSRQNSQRISNRLEQDGFIDTSPNPAHRRAKLYFLTAFGIESMQEGEISNEGTINVGSEISESGPSRFQRTNGRCP